MNTEKENEISKRISEQENLLSFTQEMETLIKRRELIDDYSKYVDEGMKRHYYAVVEKIEKRIDFLANLLTK